MRSGLAMSASISPIAVCWLGVSSNGSAASAAVRSRPSPLVACPATVRL